MERIRDAMTAALHLLDGDRKDIYVVTVLPDAPPSVKQFDTKDAVAEYLRTLYGMEDTYAFIFHGAQWQISVEPDFAFFDTHGQKTLIHRPESSPTLLEGALFTRRSPLPAAAAEGEVLRRELVDGLPPDTTMPTFGGAGSIRVLDDGSLDDEDDDGP